MGGPAQSLLNLVDVGRRFHRAVNLVRDTGSAEALDGYLVTPAVRLALSRITRGLDETGGDRAWSLVGPYGSGKSAFAVFLADLLSPSDSAGAQAARRLLNGKGDGPAAAPRQPLVPVVLTAERAPLDTLLLQSLRATLESVWKGRRGAKPRVLREVESRLNGSAPPVSRCATSDVVACFEESVDRIAASTGAGLLLVVDEAGKALEFAAQQPTRGDIYLLQALAEAAERSARAPFVVLTVLHQSFDAYAHRLGSSQRNEWAKVQGRFGELAFREGGDQTIRLTASAIHATQRNATQRNATQRNATQRNATQRNARFQTAAAATAWKRAVSKTAAWVAEGAGWNRPQLTRDLDACWPLHPVTTALLGPLFRSRLAQNERSLFAFLSAGEPLGFRDFLRTHERRDLYTVDRLYDYATGVLGSRVLARDGRRWAEIDAAMRRMPPESDATDERVLKTVGLLGMLGEQVGLRASADVVAACLDDEAAAHRAIERLRRHSVLVYRQFRDAFQIWEGSDLDLDALVSRAVERLPASGQVAAVLERHAPRTRFVARRHLFETGTLRSFDAQFVEAAPLLRGETLHCAGEGDGLVLLALPASEQEAADLRSRCQATAKTDPQATAKTDPQAPADDGAAPADDPARALPDVTGLELDRLGGGRPVILVVPAAADQLSQLARELAASQQVQASTPELRSDPAARTELTGRIDELERQVAAEVGRAFDPRRSAWFAVGRRLDVASWRDASEALSRLCDARYHGAPPIRNELLNRRALSTSAARARRSLLEAMVLRADAPQLGFEGHPPEVSMYRSLLAAHGVHRQRGGAWGFGAPKRALRPVWSAIDRFLHDTESGRRPLTELYDRLRRPPFGLREGPLPLLVVAALRAREDEVALYERGTFVPAWTPSHAERLLRSAAGFEVRRCRIDGPRAAVLARLAATMRARNDSARRPSLLDIVRALVRSVRDLTPYARRTARLSPTAQSIREALLRAREPAALLFDDLPAACGCRPIGPDRKAKARSIDAYVETLEAGLREMRRSYRQLLDRARAELAQQLRLPREAAALAAELADRAASIRDAAVDPTLRAFVLRAADEALGADDMLASLLTHLADKPPPDWTDADEDDFRVRLAHVARAFRSAESLVVGAGGAAAGGQPVLRLAVARRGQAEREQLLPLRTSDARRVAALRDRILDVAGQRSAGRNATSAAPDRDQALLALALAAEAIIDDSAGPAAPNAAIRGAGGSRTHRNKEDL